MKLPRPESADSSPLANPSGMPAEHALLGLLAMRDRGVGHGYELARGFGPEAPLGSVIRLEPGMVYHHLKKLERLGWVAVVSDASSERPGRRPFALSAEGRVELRRWLAEPVEHTREIRLEFLVKLYLALSLDPVLALRLIDEQRSLLGRLIESLSVQGSGGGETGDAHSEPNRFGQLVMDMRRAQTAAALDWLERVRHEAMNVASAADSDSVRA